VAQRPKVAAIEAKHRFANHIEELTTKRLQPIAMIDMVFSPEKRLEPLGRIQFLSATTVGLYSLQIEAQTTSSGDVNVYSNWLRDLPGVAAPPEVTIRSSRGDLTTFALLVTFKPEALSTTETPKPEPPKVEAPKPEAPKAEPSKQDATKAGAPNPGKAAPAPTKTETPKAAGKGSS
jgi:hypothetical protein